MKKNNIIKISIFIFIVISAILLNNHYGWSSYIRDTKNLEFVKEMMKDNLLLAISIYVILTIIGCVVLAVPGVTFAVFAGILFGPILGTFACLIATTLGASMAFIVGRFFLKDMIKPMLEKNKILKKLLFNDNEKSDLVILMITRMVPIFPYNLQNFAYGITDISFWKYTIYTFVFMFPGVAFFTIGSAGLTAGEDKWKYFLVAGVLAVLVTLSGMFIQRK
ncbi:VTT domain-containing protein, partial [Clostridium sp.]|uniref:TVP38/TMEM64 family protein n=1 Tax=Clostridium sp. TaxID=1506 RepID=UPI001B622A7D